MTGPPSIPGLQEMVYPPNISKEQTAAAAQKNTEEITNMVNWARFLCTSLNFLMTVVFSCVLLGNAFSMEHITGPQVFFVDRVLQSTANVPAPQLTTFIQTTYGSGTEILGLLDETTILPGLLPKMYEITGSNSILRIDAVHCNFLLFSALWIGSAFALCVTQIPQVNPLLWNTARVVLVHVWNFIGLILTIIIFSATTKWSEIPLSNLFYALVGQVMAWMYQYFHMVECTQSRNALLHISHISTVIMPTEQISSGKFSEELRKMIYMEFSIVGPMILVACMMPGSIGIDEWRIQTVLFSSWTLFALLGLHLRFRKSLVTDARTPVDQTDNKESTESEILSIPDTRGLDALGYLTYAIVLVFAMLINAMGSQTFTDPPYATTRITQARWGARVFIIVSAVLVFETIIKSVRMRFFTPSAPYGTIAISSSDVRTSQAWFILPSFIGNALILVFGSFLVKVLVFSGLSDVNGLSTWYLV
jgi:hypothetical protein